MAYVIPPRPDSFTPQGVAPGCRRIPNLYDRPLMGRRVDILIAHTNWANGEGTIKSATNWARGAPGSNTYPHYQHDRNGDAAKMLDTNRRGIGNSGTSTYWRQFGLPNASYRALVFETADRGQLADPPPVGSFFTPEQAASLARDLAYECVVHDIPPVLLAHPDGRGIAGHCFPFGYPAFTTAPGKQCPGYRKRDQLFDEIIPWTAAIVSAWTGEGAKVPDALVKLLPDTPVPTLRLGSSGPEVVTLIDHLAALGHYTLRNDGQFGPATEAGVKRLQERVGVGTDGVYGPVTATAYDEWRRRLAAWVEASKVAAPVVEQPKTVKLVANALYYVKAGDGPWSVAATAYGDGRRNPELVTVNPGNWWPGRRVVAPGIPGLETKVEAGEGPKQVLKRIHGEGADQDVTAAEFVDRELATFYRWNGGSGRMLHPGDPVGLPVTWGKG